MTDDLWVREAHRRDLGRLQEIHAAAFPHLADEHPIDRSLHSEAGFLNECEVLLVAGLERRPLASYLHGAIWSGATSHVWMMATDAPFRGRGLAARLMAAFAERVRDARSDQVALEVLEGSEEMLVPLYRSWGFKLTASAMTSHPDVILARHAERGVG